MSLLTRVVLIIAAALLPPLVMQAFNEAALHAARRADIREEAVREARHIAGEIDWIIGSARFALAATAEFPAVQAGGAGCAPLLQSLDERLAFLHGLLLLDAGGDVLCASSEAAGLATAPLRGSVAALAQEARTRGKPVLGRYLRQGNSQPPALPVAYPVRPAAGAHVLVAAIDLGWMEARLTELGLPPDASVLVADRDGTVLLGLPDAAPVGHRLAADALGLLSTAGITVRQRTDRDGLARVIADLPPSAAASDVLVEVGISTRHAFAATDAAAARGYALLGIGFIAALLLTAGMVRGTISRPVRAILATTMRWQSGDVAARVPGAHKASEFGRIAQAVNALLDAVAAGQAQLREHLAELHAVYDGSPVGLGYLDGSLRYVTVNARLAEINGLPVEAHQGRNLGELLPASVEQRVEPLLRRALAGEPVPPKEVPGVTEAAPGVPRRLLVSYQPAVGPDRTVHGVVVSILEITALRSAQAALQAALERENAELERRVAERTSQLEMEVRERVAAQAQLQQAQKMEVIGQLTGGIAHDFNNLLTAIIGNLELARSRSRDRPEVLRLLEGALRSADRGAGLTHRMLAFGRRQFLRFEPVAIPALLHGMTDLVERTIGPNIAVRVEAPEGLRPARADLNQVELVVLNLVVNARDAMPDGGTLVIAAAEERVEAGAAHPAGLAPGDYVCIAVTDTGRGMDAATQTRAFEPFYTTKPVGQGSGLGLSMVLGVAAQFEGGASLRSAPGEGTTVSVWFPCADAVPAVAAPPEPAPAGGGAGRQVLVVDDDPDVADFATVCLAEGGYSVGSVSSGAEALALLQSRPPPDLLVADLGMPGMNGLQLAAAARRLHPHLRILIATGYAQEDTDRRGIQDLPVLAKPFKAAELLARVGAMTANGPDDGTQPEVAPRDPTRRHAAPAR